MKTRGVLVSLVLVCSFACGGEAPQQSVVTEPPLHITASPPPPERARWHFVHPEQGLHAKLDLGDGRTLYAGANGRRELQKGDEALQDAPTLALGDLVGVMRDPKGGFAFAAGDGTVFVSSEPLGPLDVVRPSPVEPQAAQGKYLSVSAGKAAIVLIHPDGRLMRSADFGQSWKPVDYAGATKPYGKPGTVVLDGQGNGLLLHFPQRVYVTHDDGATWAPLSSAHMGPRNFSRDGDGRIFAWGFGGARAKLDGNALVATTDTPKPIYKAPESKEAEKSEPSPNERTESRTFLTGQRVVELTEITRHGKVREVEIGSAQLGEKIGKPATNTDLVGASGMSKHIAAYGPELVYLRDDDDADETTPTTTLFRSKDYGTTWQKESQLQGVEIAYGEGVDVAAGPKGWTYVTSLCPKDEPSSTSCSHKQIRPAGATQFEDLAFVEEFAPTAFVFDDAHGKVYALGKREGHQYVYASPLGENKFSRTKLLDTRAWNKVSLSVDPKGAVRALHWESEHSVWQLDRLDESGKAQPPEYLEIDRGTMALSGMRGVLFGYSKGWETNDGGETWTRVATNGYARSDLLCSAAGCINGDAQRVGWDLPALTTGDKVVASGELPKHESTPDTDTPPVNPIEVTCKPTGTATALTAMPSTDKVDGAGADRWASVKHDTDGKVAMVVGTKTAVRDLPLLASLPKPGANQPANQPDVREGEKVLSDGVVVARYRYQRHQPGTPYNPVDVELAWWSATTGRTEHKTLSKVPPFRVSRYGFSGTPQIVSGGLLFQGSGTDPAYFVHDGGGAVEQLTLPKNASVRNAERLPKRHWVMLDSEGSAVQASLSDDGKTWQQAAWALNRLYGTVSLVTNGDKANISLAVGSPTPTRMLFSLDSPLPEDPPAPVVLDTGSVDQACDAHIGHGRYTTYIPSDKRPVRVIVETAKGKDTWRTTYSPGTRITHDTDAGKVCTSAYIANGYDYHGGYDYQTVFLYPEPKGVWSGWRFRKPDDRSKPGVVAEQLTCK